MKRIKATAIVLVALMAVQTFASAVLATEDANTTTTESASVPTGSVVLVPSIADSLPADRKESLIWLFPHHAGVPLIWIFLQECGIQLLNLTA